MSRAPTQWRPTPGQRSTPPGLVGINDHDEIAGYHTNMPGNKGFTLHLPNTFTDENFPNSTQTQVVGINNAGETVGFYIDNQGVNHGFD